MESNDPNRDYVIEEIKPKHTFLNLIYKLFIFAMYLGVWMRLFLKRRKNIKVLGWVYLTGLSYVLPDHQGLIQQTQFLYWVR